MRSLSSQVHYGPAEGGHILREKKTIESSEREMRFLFFHFLSWSQIYGVNVEIFLIIYVLGTSRASMEKK